MIVLDGTELKDLSGKLLEGDHPNTTQNDPNTDDEEIKDEGKDGDEDEDVDLSQVQTCKLGSEISSQMYLAKTPTGQSLYYYILSISNLLIHLFPRTQS